MSSFYSPRFLEDVENSCKAIDAPFSEPVTLVAVNAFTASFYSSAVLWRTTSRPNDALNYRFYERRPVDVLSIATNTGLLKQNHPLAALLHAWSLPWGEKQPPIVPEQSCDFSAEKGLVKAWAYMGGLRPLSSILAVPNVPSTITQHVGTFHDLALDAVRHIAVDFEGESVNIYFRAPGPLTHDQANGYVKLADHDATLSQDEVAVMQKLLSPEGLTFAVTIDVATGSIKRVAFYALGIPIDATPDVGDRLARFFAEVPSYDEEEFRAVAWSFGAGGDKYVKGEKSYCGQLMPLLRAWKSTITLEDSKTASI